MFLVCSNSLTILNQEFSSLQGDTGSTFRSNQAHAPTVTAATGAADRAETLPGVSLTWIPDQPMQQVFRKVC